MELRYAEARDLQRLVELLNQLSTETPREETGPPLPAAYSQALLDILADPHQHLLVAEDGGRIVGTCVVVIVPNLSYRARPYAIVENVVVDEGHRRSGAGRALMQRAVAIAREARCYKVSLTSNRSREGSHRFYESLGFTASHLGFRLDL